MKGRLRRALWSPVSLLVGAQLLAILIFLGVEAARRRGNEAPFRYERIGAPTLPEVSLLSPDGSMRATTAHGRRTMLLHFWATWCPPCQEELPGLLDLQKELGGGGLEVVAVSLDEEWDSVRGFFGGSIPIGVVRDPSGRLAEVYGVSTLPDTYLIGPDGLPVLRFSGARNWSGSAAREVLEKHLAGR